MYPSPLMVTIFHFLPSFFSRPAFFLGAYLYTLTSSKTMFLAFSLILNVPAYSRSRTLPCSWPFSWALLPRPAPQLPEAGAQPPPWRPTASLWTGSPQPSSCPLAFGLVVLIPAGSCQHFRATCLVLLPTLEVRAHPAPFISLFGHFESFLFSSSSICWGPRLPQRSSDVPTLIS